MKSKNAPMFVAGFMAGLIVGTVLTSALLARKTAERLEQEREQLKIPIVVAAFEIREGDKFQSVHYRIKKIDRRAYIDSMLTSGEENAYLGYTAAMDISVGSPILKGALRLEKQPAISEGIPY